MADENIKRSLEHIERCLRDLDDSLKNNQLLSIKLDESKKRERMLDLMHNTEDKGFIKWLLR